MKWLLQDIVNKSTPEFNFDRVESSFEMLRKCQEHHLTTRAATPEETNYFSGLTSGVIIFQPMITIYCIPLNFSGTELVLRSAENPSKSWF